MSLHAKLDLLEIKIRPYVKARDWAMVEEIIAKQIGGIRPKKVSEPCKQ